MLAALVLLAAVVIDTRSFVMTLPGTWEHHPSQDSIAYRRGADTLFITKYEPAEPLSKSELTARAERIATMRRQLISDLARGNAASSEIVKTETGDRIAFSFDGEDRRNGKRFAISVVRLTKVVVTIALYRPITESDSGFLALQREIVSTLRER